MNTTPETQQDPAADSTSAGGPEAELNASNEQLVNQVADLQDQVLRALADAENIRRRADEEVSKARKFAVESFADSLLPVKDSLEAAIAAHAAGQTNTLEQVLEGVHATLRQLSAALERNKVAEISPKQGTKFDPHQHQAISVVPIDQEPNTVVAVLQKGYSIAERVLRPALVTVSAPR